MKFRILYALKSALLSVCLFIAAMLNTAVYGQEVTLYVHGDVGLALQEYPRCCDPPNCTQCDPSCGGALCVDYCSSWEYPCKYLQDALARAQELLDFDPETPVHIWVAATEPNNPYRPHMCSEYHNFLQRMGQGDPEYTCYWFGGNLNLANWSFHLQNSVELYGGFPNDSWDESKYGSGGANHNHRNWEEHITVLSGDLKGDDEVLIYNQAGVLVLEFFNYGDNSYAVVRAEGGINETATIDGFTIRTTNGSAFIAIDARPRLLGCTFISATSAAVHLIGESFIVFDRCYFQSPAREAIRADESATVHCVGE